MARSEKEKLLAGELTHSHELAPFL